MATLTVYCWKPSNRFPDPWSSAPVVARLSLTEVAGAFILIGVILGRAY